MQSRNKFFDDAAKVAGSAAGAFAGIRREMETLARQQLERMLASMDLVTRDEFDAVREMAVTARAEQETLLARIADLEKKLEKSAKAPAKTGKTGARKTSGKARERKDAAK